LYEHANYEKLRQNLLNVNWDSLFLTDDIELITIRVGEYSYQILLYQKSV
jgi:hypothetical protein